MADNEQTESNNKKTKTFNDIFGSIKAQKREALVKSTQARVQSINDKIYDARKIVKGLEADLEAERIAFEDAMKELS